MMSDKFRLTAVAAKWALIILLAIILILALGKIAAHCAIPPGTPGSSLCKADLTADDCGRFQELLKSRGIDMRVIEGVAYATVAQLKQKTFTVFLRCACPQGNVHIVVISFVKDNLKTIETRPTGERMLGA